MTEGTVSLQRGAQVNAPALGRAHRINATQKSVGPGK